MRRRIGRGGRATALVAALWVTHCGGDVPGAASLTGGSPLAGAIIDGTPSGSTDFPATGVLLYITSRPDGHASGSMLCTATLIAPDLAVVAGHCNLAAFGNTAPTRYYFSRALDVSRFGLDSLALPELTVPATGVVSHPRFSIYAAGPGIGRTHDIGLVFLAEPVTDVVPAPLVAADEAAALHVGAEVYICGYGRRFEQPRAHDDGQKYHGRTVVQAIGACEMQVGTGAPRPHKCHGDSGGPTFLPVWRAGAARMALAGITSHAFDGEDCRHGGVDTRVDGYLSWIIATAGAACVDGRRPACGN